MKQRNNVRAVIFDDKFKVPVFLLLYARKGYWQNPQGGIESGESDYAALQAEVLEETGISEIEIIPNTKYSVSYDAERKGEPIRVTLNAYAVRASIKSHILISQSEDEHLGYMWAPYDVCINLLSRYPEQIEVFVEVCKMANLIPK